MKISEIGGEFELIKRINKKTKIFSKDIFTGIGDDAAVLKNGKNLMLLTTDMMVEDDHFSLKYSTPEQIGMKAMEVNVSDIAAMGGIPKHAVISLALPKNITLEFINGLYKGINKAGNKYKVNIIGGDMTHSKQVVINIAMIGYTNKGNLSLRSDAKINDFICVTGDLGKSTAGLNLLLKNKKGKSIKPHLEPKARLDISKKITKYVNAMEDVSDGLAQEVRNICSQSNLGAAIYKEKIPLAKSTIEDAKKVKKDPYDYALYGGEDFELVFTINKRNFDIIKNKLKIKFYVVGKILQKKEGIYILDKNKKLKPGKGFDHFR